MDRNTLDQLAAALTRYGDSSTTALANGRNTIRGGAREMADTVNQNTPEWAKSAMALGGSLLPGTGTMDSMRLASESAGQWRDGRYGRALDTMGDAILAPVNDAMFLLPGGGFVKAIPK